MPPAVVHLQPTAAVAPRALLPGDPGRALALAQALLERPVMSNHARGLWGYTGLAADGEPLTIQATGMGGPSTAIVVDELADLGVRVAIRTGTARALTPELAPGELVAAAGVLAEDGVSRALGAAGLVPGDPVLSFALGQYADHAGVLVSTDLIRDPALGDARREAFLQAGALAADLETGAAFAVGARRGLRVACVVAIAEAGGERLDEAGRTEADAALGQVAAHALGLPAPAPRTQA